MAAEVEPVRQAAARELGYEREQKEREPRETTLVTPCTLHPQQFAPLGAPSATG
jgi:hypothetical protein